METKAKDKGVLVFPPKHGFLLEKPPKHTAFICG
jgi:hypothetical protein